MPSIALKDILINARQESYRMRHFYLGVEHLFIALLEIKGGLASSILEAQGFSTEYVIDAVRRKVGKGSRHRLWAGIPNTPRSERVLAFATEYAGQQGRIEINEQDMLMAILKENDSIPVRVLNALRIDLDNVKQESVSQLSTVNSQQPYVKIDFGSDFDRSFELSDDQLFVLRRMFHGYTQIRIERRLTGGFTKALLLIVTPIDMDNRADAAVVVKIDEDDVIQDEARRYNSHVKNSLPQLSARLEDRPVAPETSDLAGLKYTLVAGSDGIPHDLRTAVKTTLPPDALAAWLGDELFTTYGAAWWGQRRPFRFQVWREYDWLLPPILTLEVIKDTKTLDSARVIGVPVRRNKIKQLEYGEAVVVENFTIQRVYRDRSAIQLAVGQSTDAASAYKIEVRGLDLTKDAYYRGEVLERIAGRVWKTRDEYLLHAARALEPDFDIHVQTIPLEKTNIEKLPNPIFAYEELLDRHVNGSLSRIHGDMHLGNIVLGPNNSASLIDFANARDGHTIFDWATLEVSILSEVVMAGVGETWEDVRVVLRQIIALNAGVLADEGTTNALAPVKALRGIVETCLATRDQWSEYYTALALCGLRAITWDTMALPARRLMFLVSALCMHEVRDRQAGHPPTDTGEESDLTDRYADNTR